MNIFATNMYKKTKNKQTKNKNTLQLKTTKKPMSNIALHKYISHTNYTFFNSKLPKKHQKNLSTPKTNNNPNNQTII